MRPTLQKLCLFVAVALSCSVALAWTDYNRPHPHEGLLKPYKAGPFESLILKKSDKETLKAGKPVMIQTENDDPKAGGGAICVQDVEAPKEAVWSQILNFDKYKGKVPKVLESQNYKVQQNKDGSCTIKTKMKLGVLPGYSVSQEYQCHQQCCVWFIEISSFPT